ncbi:PTS ascorbate transporter subunit IIC [Anoxybacillus rupiensis]|uniref:Ascorbate-specific PTS system EIIC component n=1 Tax=Anoxybacteroides rupiense TaxID=311460 RepID=A0ABT5WBJ6_9BACL|nr:MULTISPECIES: PTS ascorbate transporter subunit IIC [Anoxybacillus]KXG10730.1 Ascorbate-specific permease IIC component UlaA [Anoxybacillus sp. P3H1B]MBS2772171.1 PTS ascorbate transporter subunit IIC [Anoxybacillus rupiensis]MDE8565466.1 PTS ascorbate transporter subunit IIC [Anoxybacillus rupiensis]QHC03849.1 PTS ascorbate transporter subunit IIC [Anoxybacillus sp. PDR2]
MLDLLMKDILGSPAILVGLFAFLGLVLQKKRVSDIISGTLKTIMGFILLNGGAAILIQSLDAFGKLFEKAFAIQGVIPNNEAIVAIAQQTFGKETALIMLFGMIVNLLLARFTRFKYIFLTGHHTLFMACLISAVLATSGVAGALLVVIGSIILGALMVFMPALLQPYMRQVTGTDQVALGHFGSVGYFASAWIGKRFGNKARSTEDLHVPRSLSFLRDTSVAMSLTMTILFLIVVPLAGKEFVETQLSGGVNFLVFSLMQGITFAAGVYVVLAGVRMLIAEIVPAFKGIADKVVNNAKPALDCPTVFPYAPNAVIIGFLSSFVAGMISMLILPAVGLKVIVPGLIPHFFTGAAAGVFGNATGGRRGAILGAFVNGLLISFLPALLLPVLGSLGFENTTFGDSDFGIVGILLSYLIKWFS